MSKTRTIKLSLVCMLLAMMLTVSCAKKTVETEPADDAAVTDTTETPADDTAMGRRHGRGRIKRGAV